MTDLVIEESPVDFVSIIHQHATQIGCHLRSKTENFTERNDYFG